MARKRRDGGKLDNATRRGQTAGVSPAGASQGIVRAEGDAAMFTRRPHPFDVGIPSPAHILLAYILLVSWRLHP